ncbi:OmpW family protein [Pseudoxanthomonas sp. SGNA-20]|jgi:Outer membrane protein W|uniref:Outer membrane protein n=1 Tax=Pseudoxanthomonas taiwanensis J19 TaxID=935569 RepID=A0A562D227_9GAMM|nr:MULTISPECIES: OmpW family outer membrane protein [Pseudoxanthomonas]RRN58741.1 OmpW family protein [Pseudoxanthomonas sp. SGNA-20]RRN80716.1 OmpW family protein [Pseudoxanthomonas sp. SGD-10]TWH03642.1 outer membrane protein [Pseudoxanthomonas taiwanensis J19]
MKHKLLPLLAASLAAVAAAPAFAQSAGDWTLGVGLHQVDPKSDNGKLADGTLPLAIDSDAKPSVTFEYFVKDNLGVEVLGALPFKHEIAVKGVGKVGQTKHLPPTITLQYHFNSAGKVSPLLGVGINYTTFFSEDTTGALAGTKLKLDDSFGLAAHAGLDFKVSEKASVRVDVRWADIDTDVKVDGAKLGTANIDPLVYGASYVMKF